MAISSRATVGATCYSKVDEMLRRHTRESHNGFEVQVVLKYCTRTDWDWVAIRYPAGSENIRVPSEVVKRFHGMNWPQIIAWLTEYLAQHPDDGFWTI